MTSTPLDPQKRADIFLVRGDSSSINFTLQGYDLTGATVYFTAKPTIANGDDEDATAVISTQVTEHTDPTNGITVIPLSATLTNVAPGTYFYDIQIKMASGTIISIPVRVLKVFGDITRRTSSS